MQRKAICKALLCAIAVFAASSDARVFFTGSNPMLSSIALPQDLLLIPGGDKISTYTAWQTFPWWGDIDEPENRPGKKYVLTGEKTSEYEHYASINEFSQRFGLSHWRNEHFRTNYEITYSAQHLKAEAKGTTAGETGVPYEYYERHAIREGAFKAMLATYLKSHPIGMSFSLGGIQTSPPRSELFLGSGSAATASNRLFWGWDGGTPREQDNLALGWLVKADGQLGITFGQYNKIGSHFRLYTGRLRNYNWNDSLSNYETGPKDIHNYTIRLYGIKNWYKQDKFRFNTTVLTRYTFVDSIGRQTWQSDLVDYRENARTFVFQINPNVNIYPWDYPMSFIDAAILCNYQHMRYDFLNERGSLQSIGWWGEVEDYPWERFSYARENFFELALDIFASIPVFGMKDQSAGVVISALLWRRYKWMDKYFGNSDWQTGDFTTTNIRSNFEKETWLNAVFNIVYRRGSVMYRLDIAQPLIYSLTPRTTVYDADGTVEAGKSMEKMWLSQAGFKIGFFVSTDLTNFIRYQPFARPPAGR